VERTGTPIWKHAPGCPFERECGVEQAQGALSRRIIVLVVTAIVAVRLVSAWPNPGLKGVPGVARVWAVVGGLAYQQEVEMKAFDSAPVWLPVGRCFVGQSVLGGA
jgi:hypothetical protein